MTSKTIDNGLTYFLALCPSLLHPAHEPHPLFSGPVGQLFVLGMLAYREGGVSLWDDHHDQEPTEGDTPLYKGQYSYPYSNLHISKEATTSL